MSGPAKYRRLPTEVIAIQWTGDNAKACLNFTWIVAESDGKGFLSVRSRRLKEES